MSKRTAIYARVFTDEQTPDNQLAELRAVADHMGWQVVQEYIDRSIAALKAETSDRLTIECMRL